MREGQHRTSGVGTRRSVLVQEGVGDLSNPEFVRTAMEEPEVPSGLPPEVPSEVPPEGLPEGPPVTPGSETDGMPPEGNRDVLHIPRQ